MSSLRPYSVILAVLGLAGLPFIPELPGFALGLAIAWTNVWFYRAVARGLPGQPGSGSWWIWPKTALVLLVGFGILKGLDVSGRAVLAGWLLMIPALLLAAIWHWKYGSSRTLADEAL
jgi:hypothetical protein